MIIVYIATYTFMSSEFILDRGPAEYFHGRKEIIDTFNSALEVLRKKNKGTTFLIQGAPGAGKTALLDVLSRQAKSNGWEVADIAIKNLYSPVSMAQSLGEAYVLNSEAALKAGIKFIEGGLVESVAGHASSEEILKRLAPENGLILMLDEAQRLHKIPDNSERHTVASDTLEMIHNGKLESPVILLTAGLGTSESAYGSLGISRFMRKCRVPLGCLSKESTCAVIRDFLIHEGGVSKPPLVWVETIAERTHGWPQHIVSYADSAAKYLASHRTSTDEGLNIVLQQGRTEQIGYYKVRLKGIDRKKRQVLAKIFADVPLGKTMERDDIMSAIQEEYTEEVAEELFKKALERGIIDEREDGDYGIPIPSMHRWLIDEYIRNKSQDIPPTPKQLPPRPEQLLLPPKKDDQPSVKKDKGESQEKGGFSMER